ncbi:MAG: hypothetical protein IPF92_03570 [Myxococcales bacterium]|jgi:hypothetical protein|nr:hypothetical protein [Myxococcales bacterium]MBL0196658.1 hypothetical protein [Myxococcales bacterium]HQY62262.1 hypothetical protein [Polyangiaceae bacterium]
MGSRLAHRVALTLAASAAIPLCAPSAGGAAAPEALEAAASCERSAEPGRIRCTLTVTPLTARRETLEWADAVVSAAPAFATPLRGRLTPVELGPTGARFAFALAARTRGRGPLALRVRAVVCEGRACRTVTVERVVDLVVGTPES